MHIKTYSCDPLLIEFYSEADKVFENNILQLDKDLPIEKVSGEASLKNELLKLETIILKLEADYIIYIIVMHRSMKSFKDHISQAHHSVLMDFIFPMPIKGITYK